MAIRGMSERELEELAAMKLPANAPPWKKWEVDWARRNVSYKRTMRRVQVVRDAIMQGQPYPPGDPIPEVYLPVGHIDRQPATTQVRHEGDQGGFQL